MQVRAPLHCNSVCASLKTLCHIRHSGSRGLWKRSYSEHIISRNSVSDSTVSKTVLLRTLRHAIVILVRRSRRLSVSLKSLTKPLGMDFHTTSHAYFLSSRSSLRFRRWSELENPPLSITVRISSALLHVELNYFS